VIGHHNIMDSTKSYFKLRTLLLPFVLAIFLVVLSFFNFLLFHTLAEFFAITIAILMCVVAWHMYPFTRNNYLMFLGGGYFWIGVLDLLHTLSYKDIGIFPGSASVNMGVQFWIGTRYLEALLLLIAPWFLNHSFNRIKSFIFIGVVSAIIIGLVLSGKFPEGFIEGKGLTAFKVNSEYIIIALLALSIYHLNKQRTFLDPGITNVIILSIILTMCAELAFTFYISVFGISNLVGHIFKLFSFWLIFLAVIRTTLQEPFLAMSRGASTYDAIPDATIVIDDTGIIRQANNAACSLSLLDRDTIIGKKSHDVFHVENTTRQDCVICRALENNVELKGWELEIDDAGNWFDFSLSKISSGSTSEGTVEVIRDITQRKISEEKVEGLNLLMNSIVENLPHMLFVKDAKDHRYIEWNKAAEDLTGFLKNEMLGYTDFDFWPEEQAQFFIDKDDEVVSDRKLLDIPEEPITTKYNGNRTLHTKKIPIYDSKGRSKYLLGISEDITEKLQTEAILNRSQKMEAIGQMSGGISHDFNNQLGVISGYLELLAELESDDKKQKWISEIKHATQRCIDLTRQLMVFSRSGDIDKSVVDINNIINKMKTIIQTSLTPEIKIEYFLSPDLWNTEVNKGSFQDVVLNLVLNARDAMPKGGSFVIETNNIVLNDSFANTNPNIDAGEYVQIVLCDSGEGMSMDVIEHIFEPFYTSKAVGQGTGLGLSMVYGFVHRYGGDIVVTSKVGEGATFRIYLPASKNSVSVSNTNSKVEVDLPKGNESILVVDDEAGLLSLTSHNLRALGYQVYSAENSTDALFILEREKSIDLLFTDVVMPGELNGYALAKKCLSINPEIKIIVTSGYEARIEKEKKEDDFDYMRLPKPYSRLDLSEMVRQVLDG